VTWNTIVTLLVTAFLGTAFGARLTSNREKLNWTRDQRLKAYVELLTAINNCYDTFKKLAESMKELGYPADARDNLKVQESLDDWRKWYGEIDRCLAFADLVGSEHFIEYRPRIDLGFRSYQQALIIDIVRRVETRPEEWESVSGRTVRGEISVRHTLRADLNRIDSFGQRVSDWFWSFRRWVRRMGERLTGG
jgi:hypothetical protein